MGNNTTVGLSQLASNMGGDVLMAAKNLEALGLQKNKILLSQLYTFQILLEEVYGTSCPTPEDYANRRDLIRIFNEIAREMYGNNGQCPVVENFGSFLMDMFNAKSDLDLSINFSDQSFESDRVAKTKTLRKFAKKFYSLRKNGHVTTVELILSARVPVLKVTDSGSGIECDLSVGNRDGIAKSQIVRMISSIDERFQKLSFMMKAWAKAHDINSSKDGTLNSLSLILLAAFHLQTRDIPILPPFSAIFKGGMDPATVKLYLPGFLYYGKKNKESLAELFVSLLVKLESVETLWSRGLCASTYEGSWIYRNPNTTGYISIEDFTDRSQNTARAVKSKKMNKIYSCIRCSIEQIQSFTAGIIDATQLKCLLFGRVSPITKKVCANPSQKEKRLAQDRPGEGQRPEKQSKHVHNSFSVEAPTPSRSSGVEKMKVRTGRNTDPATSDTLTSFQELDKSQESQTPNPIQNKKDLTQGGSAKGQSPGNLYNYGHTCITEAPNPSKTNRVKKMKSRTGKKTDIATSDTPTSFQGSDKSQEILTPNPGQKEEKRPAQGGPAEGQRPGKQVKHGLVPCSTEASTPSRRSKFKKKKSKTGKNFDPVTSGIQTPFQGSDKSQEILTPNPGQKKKKRPTQGGPVEGQRPGKQVKHGLIHRSTEGLTPSRTSKFKKKKSKTGRKFDPVTSNAQTSILGLNKSQETLTGSCQPLPVLPVSSSVGYKSLGADIGALNNATHSSQKVQLSSTLPNQSSGEIRRQSFPVGERPYLSNAPSEQCRRYGRQKTHVDALSHATPRFSESHPPYIYTTRSSGGFTPNRTHVETWKHAAPNILLRETLPVSGYQGFNTEKNIFETLKVAGPNISLEQPYSHPNYQLSQGSGRFRSENYHVETPRYAPNVLAAPSVPVPNLRVQGGESLPRMHFEFPSYSATQQYSSSLANLASGFGPERTHAEIINQTPSLQTSLYTLASRPSNPMPFHQPYHLHHREPSGLQRYHDPHHSFHLAPSQFAPNMHPYQS